MKLAASKLDGDRHHLGVERHLRDRDPRQVQKALEYSSDTHGIGLLGSFGVLTPTLEATGACHTDGADQRAFGALWRQPRNGYGSSTPSTDPETLCYKEQPQLILARSPTFIPEDPD